MYINARDTVLHLSFRDEPISRADIFCGQFNKKQLANRVYIGNNFVPLWCILLDAYEEDNDITVNLKTQDDNRISYVFITIVIILVLIVGFLFMINII